MIDPKVKVSTRRRCRMRSSSPQVGPVGEGDADESAGLILLIVINPAGNHPADQILEGVRHWPEAGDPGLDKADLTVVIDTEKETAVLELAKWEETYPQRVTPFGETCRRSRNSPLPTA
ncbi:hypothetical protein [Streptomyces sp. DSM 40713]|nr:hypothetical protein [Streptomyces sp. DSM 40713]